MTLRNLHCWNIFSREAVCGVRNQHTSLPHGAVTHYYAPEKKGFKKLKKVRIWLYLIGRPDDMVIPLMNSISLNKKDIAIEGFQRTMVHIQLVPSRLPFNYVRHCFTSSVLCFWLFLELFVSCIFHSFCACLFFVCTLFLLQRFVSSSSLLCGFFVRSSLSVQFVSEKIGKGEFLKI